MTDYRPPCTRAPDLWFSDHLVEINAAKTICRTRCAMIDACFRASVALDCRYGVFGGLGASERDELRKKRQRAATQKEQKRLRGAA